MHKGRRKDLSMGGWRLAANPEVPFNHRLSNTSCLFSDCKVVMRPLGKMFTKFCVCTLLLTSGACDCDS